MFIFPPPILGSYRGLCRQVRGAHLKSSDLVVTVMPESLVDENLLEIAAGGSKKKKPAATFGGLRLKKCHWQDTSKFVAGWVCCVFLTSYPPFQVRGYIHFHPAILYAW